MIYPSQDFKKAYLATEGIYRKEFDDFYKNNFKNPLSKIELTNPSMQQRGIDVILSLKTENSIRFVYVEEKVDRLAHRTGNIGLELDNGFGDGSGWFFNTKADFICYLILNENKEVSRILWLSMSSLRKRYNDGDFKKYPTGHCVEDNHRKASSIKLIPISELEK